MRKRETGAGPGRGRRRWLLALGLLLLLGLTLFLGLEGAIGAHARTEITGQPQVMVIFGCKVEPTGPSVLLKDRLDAALSYLKDHPEMTVVVTGGKGDDEHQSEGACMYDYLTAHGVAGERILREERARNTWQNVLYTRELLEREGLEEADCLLVSSGFHLLRIKLLWERGTGRSGGISTLAAPVSHFPSRVHMFFREPLALVKSFLFDR